VQMERFSRGIDNAHVDVRISSAFTRAASELVRAMVRYDIASTYWGESESQPSPAIQEEFRRTYRGLMEAATGRSQSLNQAEWVRLAQLALFKHLLQLVPRAVEERRLNLAKSRDQVESLQTGRHLEFHERLVVVAREAHTIAYRVYRRLFRIVERLETSDLRKLRKSLFGVSWPVPREALFNPVLHLPNLFDEGVLMQHYPILFFEDKGKSRLDGLNRCVIDTFKSYLPTWTRPPSDSGTGAERRGKGRFHITERLDQGGLGGFLETEIILRRLLSEDEYKNPLYSWLDEPNNLERLLNQGETGEDKHWRHFARAVSDDLVQRLQRLDIMPRIVASYWTPRIVQELRGKVPARIVYQYLVGEQDKRKLLRRLGSGQGDWDPALAAKTLDFAGAELRQLKADSRREYALRVLSDFLILRRDLKLAYKTFEAMDHIRFLDDEEDVNLSRANGLLHEFRLGGEKQEQERIVSHVILKADLRGSTRITAELRAKKLNPATHFSQNFFNPINEWLPDFGANKVFVEGDAVILSFLEYAGNAASRLCTAHACGMALRILEVVARQNLINRRHGLPELELGLGIAFAGEEPTFLYDEERRIMISPAINLADRLSSCAGLLRESALADADRVFRVEILFPGRGGLPADNKTDVLRYNVNGIELDKAAFARLREEVTFQRMDLKLDGRPGRFHVARYPDRSGKLQWLAVRESAVGYWENGRIDERRTSERRFYEVVSDARLLALLRSKLRSTRDAVTQPGGPADPSTWFAGS